MAHKKGVGSTDNGRDSNAKRRGVKLFGGQLAVAGNIIVRQKGTKYHPGENVYMGRDFTLHAKVDGTVAFKRRQKNRMYVSILPFDVVEETIAAPAPKKKKEAPAPVVEEAPVAAAPVEEEPKKEKAPAKAKAEKKEKAPAKAKAEKKEKAPAKAKAEKKEKAPAKPKAAKAKVEKIELPSGKKIKQDDLKMVEGVGPKIEGLLNDGGIVTWADLANAPVEKVQAILDEAGPRYRMHSPTTWAKQAKLADAKKWQDLEDLQGRLVGGREPEDIK